MLIICNNYLPGNTKLQSVCDIGSQVFYTTPVHGYPFSPRSSRIIQVSPKSGLLFPPGGLLSAWLSAASPLLPSSNAALVQVQFNPKIHNTLLLAGPKSRTPGPIFTTQGPIFTTPGPIFRTPGSIYRTPGPKDRYPGHQDRYPGLQDRYRGPQNRYPGPQDPRTNI